LMKAVFFLRFESRESCTGKTSGRGISSAVSLVEFHYAVPVSPAHVLAFSSRSSPAVKSASRKKTTLSLSYAFSGAPWGRKEVQWEKAERLWIGHVEWLVGSRDCCGNSHVSGQIFAVCVKRQQMPLSRRCLSGLTLCLGDLRRSEVVDSLEV